MLKTIKRYLHDFFEVYAHEFKMIFHDQGLILFLTFLPLGYPIIYSLIYNPELVREVKMVVVDNDRTSSSREFIREMDATQNTHIIGYAADMTEARCAMDSHECFGIMEVPDGFGRAIGSGEQAQAVMYCDMSLLLRYRGFLVSATDVAMNMGAQIQAADINDIAPLATTLSTGDFLPIRNVAMGDITSGFDSFIMPGVLILILQQCLILAIGMAGGAKHERPSLVGYNPVNQSPSVMMSMLGQMACYLTLIILPLIFLVHYVPLIFHFPMAGDTLQELAFLLPLVLASICLGFCIQGIVWERETIFVIWVATSIAFLFLSGLTWPRYAMTGVWRVLSDIVPASWGVEGFIRMNSNGANLDQVTTDYRNLWILTGAYFILAYLVQRFAVKPYLRKRWIALHQS